ncbi:Rho GTPase-activating protein 100F, partial [Clonorchis sinensis]
MAEESFDSGVSSEHSQYTIEHKSCPDPIQKHNDLCADLWSPTSCSHNGEGYYGPKPPPYCSHIHSDSSLDHVKISCLKRNYRQRSKPLLHSDQLASDTEPVGSVHSNPVQFIRRKAKAPAAQIQVFSDLASVKTMSSNPREYPNGSIGPQRSSVYPEVAGSRGMEGRVVHFARDQRDLGEKATCERSLLPDISLDERIRLTDSRSRTSLPEYSRPPLVRNYSARDYVYLPSLQQNQMASSVPVLSRQQTLRSLLANQLDEHSEVGPSEPGIESRPRESTQSAHFQVQPTSEVTPGRTVLDRLTSDMSSVTLGTDQERQQLLSALLSASKPTTSSSSQTSVLQSILQRVNPQSGIGTSRPPAGQTSSTMPGQAFAQGQLKLQASGSAEDYANYQSLDAILGQMHAQPPPPAPYQPVDFRPLADIYQAKSTVPDESYSVHSTTGIPATHSLSGLPPLHIDPMINVECRLPDVPTEARPEDRFRDFLLLPSERCVTTTYAQSADCASQPLHDWSYPDQSPHATQPKSNNLNGLLVVHLVAGNGLSSSQIMLRDLYCVVEMDSIRKARSMIRTSSSFFEWNEVFELDMEDSRFLAFLLYQWDPRTKHRLCFYGGIDLRNLIGRLISLSKKSTSFGTTGPNTTGQKRYQQILLSPALTLLPSNFEKIALQLEPRGVLYLEFGYYPLERIYHRYQPTVSTSLHHASISDDVLFGVTIDELMERERNIVQLTSGLGRAPTASRFVNDSLYIPLFIRKCVEEIDRRGTEVVGIYRLAGSVWMKLQVRELFNQVTRSTLRAVFQGDRKALEGITGLIDLSPARVPDIHAITALFKDFLRELPEPLFTSALYPMFYDAMQVTLPDFSQSGAKLMLNILDCLPTNNQEILLYLLDHFKRITSQSEINRMNTYNLANCLAPVLFYPAPNSARNMDPAILEPRKMAEIFQFILEIWPDERKPPTCAVSGVHSWPPAPYHFPGQEETIAR